MNGILASNDVRIGFPNNRPHCREHKHGWLLETHIRVFSALITQSTRVIIELGCWYGSSSTWFAENFPNSTIYCIDLWDDNFILKDDHYMNPTDLLEEHSLYPTFLANMWRYRDRVVPMRMQTTEALKLLKRYGIEPDVIYIDADHHYDAVKLDISTCLDLFPRAILIGDDYGNYEDVRRAVHECADENLKTGCLCLFIYLLVCILILFTRLSSGSSC